MLDEQVLCLPPRSGQNLGGFLSIKFLNFQCERLQYLPQLQTKVTFFGDVEPRRFPFLDFEYLIPVRTTKRLFRRYLQDAAGIQVEITHPRNSKVLAHLYIGFDMLFSQKVDFLAGQYQVYKPFCKSKIGTVQLVLVLNFSIDERPPPTPPLPSKPSNRQVQPQQPVRQEQKLQRQRQPAEGDSQPESKVQSEEVFQNRQVQPVSKPEKATIFDQTRQIKTQELDTFPNTRVESILKRVRRNQKIAIEADQLLLFQDAPIPQQTSNKQQFKLRILQVVFQKQKAAKLKLQVTAQYQDKSVEIFLVEPSQLDNDRLLFGQQLLLKRGFFQLDSIQYSLQEGGVPLCSSKASPHTGQDRVCFLQRRKRFAELLVQLTSFQDQAVGVDSLPHNLPVVHRPIYYYLLEVNEVQTHNLQLERHVLASRLLPSPLRLGRHWKPCYLIQEYAPASWIMRVQCQVTNSLTLITEGFDFKAHLQAHLKDGLSYFSLTVPLKHPSPVQQTRLGYVRLGLCFGDLSSLNKQLIRLQSQLLSTKLQEQQQGKPEITICKPSFDSFSELLKLIMECSKKDRVAEALLQWKANKTVKKQQVIELFLQQGLNVKLLSQGLSIFSEVIQAELFFQSIEGYRRVNQRVFRYFDQECEGLDKIDLLSFLNQRKSVLGCIGADLFVGKLGDRLQAIPKVDNDIFVTPLVKYLSGEYLGTFIGPEARLLFMALADKIDLVKIGQDVLQQQSSLQNYRKWVGRLSLWEYSFIRAHYQQIYDHLPKEAGLQPSRKKKDKPAKQSSNTAFHQVFVKLVSLQCEGPIQLLMNGQLLNLAREGDVCKSKVTAFSDISLSLRIGQQNLQSMALWSQLIRHQQVRCSFERSKGQKVAELIIGQNQMTCEIKDQSQVIISLHERKVMETAVEYAAEQREEIPVQAELHSFLCKLHLKRNFSTLWDSLNSITVYTGIQQAEYKCGRLQLERGCQLVLKEQLYDHRSVLRVCATLGRNEYCGQVRWAGRLDSEVVVQNGAGVLLGVIGLKLQQFQAKMLEPKTGYRSVFINLRDIVFLGQLPQLNISFPLKLQAQMGADRKAVDFTLRPRKRTNLEPLTIELCERQSFQTVKMTLYQQQSLVGEFKLRVDSTQSCCFVEVLTLKSALKHVALRLRVMVMEVLLPERPTQRQAKALRWLKGNQLLQLNRRRDQAEPWLSLKHCYLLRDSQLQYLRNTAKVNLQQLFATFQAESRSNQSLAQIEKEMEFNDEGSSGYTKLGLKQQFLKLTNIPEDFTNFSRDLYNDQLRLNYFSVLVRLMSQDNKRQLTDPKCLIRLISFQDINQGDRPANPVFFLLQHNQQPARFQHDTLVRPKEHIFANPPSLSFKARPAYLKVCHRKYTLAGQQLKQLDTVKIDRTGQYKLGGGLISVEVETDIGSPTQPFKKQQHKAPPKPNVQQNELDRIQRILSQKIDLGDKKWSDSEQQSDQDY